MTTNLYVCTLDPLLEAQLRTFRLNHIASNCAGRAIIMKIDPNDLVIRCDQIVDDCSISDLLEFVPDGQPRLIAYTFRVELKQGGIRHPLFTIFSTPRDCPTKLQMIYASSVMELTRKTEIGKVIEVRDFDEEFNQEYICEKLGLIVK